MKIERKDAGNRPVGERIYDHGEVEQTLNTEDRKLQASRCMDCGIPFCHWACPVRNVIPEWQDLLYRGNWREAIELLHSTNNFPEFTGRICPAPCESSCVLTLHQAPVTIRENEVAIAEMAFREGYIRPEPPQKRTGRKVAVVGSGPAGLACADLLNKWGHRVTVFEKEDAAGGLIRYGIPDFKLNKRVVDRRLNIFLTEGMEIKTGVEAGRHVTGKQLLNDFDAVCLAIGAEQPRDLPVEGRELDGIHFAMDFLRQQNKVNRGKTVPYDYRITAKDKNVVVIGGGDTGSDCVGTAIRQGAKKVTQIEIMPVPMKAEGKHNPVWPYQPKVLKTSSSHEEGCERRWSLATQKFTGRQNKVTGLYVCEVEWQLKPGGPPEMKLKPETTGHIEAGLVLLAMGFVHPVHAGPVKQFGLDLDERKNIRIDGHYQTSTPGVFATGDAASGASLVVHAIYAGRKAAESIDESLRG